MKNEPGVLYSILQPFAARGLNLTKIESRPTKRRPWEYVNFVDFEGHRDTEGVRGALAEVRERVPVPQDPRILPGRLRSPRMSVPWESLANEHILGIAPYEPGKPIEELERELGIADAIKLASNENPLPPVRAGPAGDRPPRCAQLNRYPDGSGFYLRQALARRHGVTADHIVLGNGLQRADRARRARPSSGPATRR